MERKQLAIKETKEMTDRETFLRMVSGTYREKTALKKSEET